MSILGDNLTLLRLDRGYTRPDITAILGVPTITYRNWEYGKYEPNIDMLIKLSRFYKVTIDELVGNTKMKESNFSNKKTLEENREKLKEKAESK